MILEAHGRYGMGDSMSYLNIAHTRAYCNDTDVTLNIYWEHDKDFYYHFEDPETIVERTDYIHNFYKDKDRVKVNHFFNIWMGEDHPLKESQLIDEDGEDILWGKQKCTRTWFLDEDRLPKTKENKIVLWRPTFNADLAREWKRGVSHEEWDEAIDIMKGYGYDITELTYRTPIREALYHISEAELVMCYDGMWHYISTMLKKPTIFVASSTIGMYNTYNGVMVRGWGDMKRLLDNWNTKQIYWDVKKHDPDKDDVIVPVTRYQEYNLTGKEFVETINLKMGYWLHLAYEKKIDWSDIPIMNNNHERVKNFGI